MTDIYKAAQQALDALVQIHPANMTPMAEEVWNKAIVMLGAALAEQPAEQESVACWNALQDFSTDAPAPRSHLLKAEDDQITMLTTQRDELLEALKKAAEHIEAMIIEHKPLRLKQHCWQQVRNARAAIAKVEGGAA